MFEIYVWYRFYILIHSLNLFFNARFISLFSLFPLYWNTRSFKSFKLKGTTWSLWLKLSELLSALHYREVVTLCSKIVCMERTIWEYALWSIYKQMSFSFVFHTVLVCIDGRTSFSCRRIACNHHEDEHIIMQMMNVHNPDKM